MTETARRRAEEAMELLSCKTITETLEGMNLALVTRWREAKTVEEREAVHVEQLVLQKFHGVLLEHVRVAALEDTKNNVDHSAFIAFFRNLFPKRIKQE